MINQSIIYQWIVTTWNSDATLSSIDLYAGEAPEDVCHPFVVFINVGDTLQSDTCTDYDAYTFQFSVFDTNEQLGNVLTIMGNIRDAFDNAQNAGDVQMSRYINSFTVRDVENKGWQGIMEYMIYTE